MTISIRLLAAVMTLGVAAACSESPTSLRANDAPVPSFKADPGTLSIANLAGSWTQTPRQRVPWSDGVTPGGLMDRWYVLSLQQSGGTLKGTANGFAQYFYEDGSVRTGAVSTGGGLKLSGTVASLTDAVIVFERGGGESRGSASYLMTVSADGRSMTVVNPVPGGFQGFSR
jgi:hypothetical protein